MFCVPAMVMAQGFTSPAGISEADDQTPVAVTAGVRAPALVPLDPRTGDVNLDGAININDVTDLINMLLKHNITSSGDVSQDGQVNINDVTDLIDMILRGGNKYDMTDALAALHEVYYSMRLAGWSSTGNTHQSFGISAFNLMAEVMGDDMIMGAQGSGWFWFDAGYNVKTRYTSSAWRSYDLWTAYYTWIANANYLLSACQSMTGTAAEKNYVKGQAYAIRAYSYFMLAQSFARTYKGHESDPCVPLFTGTVWNGTTAALRSTVAQVYAQIDADIAQAVNLLNGTAQLNPEHMGYAVALGLRARIALVKEDWATAYNSAVAAINASGKSIQNVNAFAGLNDVTAGNVMWGADIPEQESGMYASFFAHMSANIAYGQRAPKMISLWLYNKMSNTDARRAWWRTNDTGVGPAGYVQQKFNVVPGTEWEGDYIWMRVEEMYLTAAEAACRRGQTTTAKNYLNNLMAKRDASYSCSKTGTQLGALTTDETGSLLEEILIQRRIELWGEDGRIYTIRRLRQGFERTEENGWPLGLTLPSRHLQDPESYAWVMTLPLSEFYNYYSRLIESVDQNPIDDYPSGTVVDVERNPQHISIDVASLSYTISPNELLTITIPITRPSVSSKPYYALIRFGNTYDYAYFAPYSLQGYAIFSYSRDYITHETLTVSLTDIEQAVATSSQRTSMTVDITVRNKNPEGQHISFETASQELMTEQSYLYSVPITLTRAKTTDSYSAHVFITDVDGSEYDQWVNFASGESTATIYKSFSEMELGHSYSLVCRLSDDDIATGNPALGQQITTTTVTVTCTSNWEDMGTGVYNSPDFWQESLTRVFQRNKSNPNMYRIKGLYSDNYDIVFTIEDGMVYIEEQPCFIHPSYGLVYMHGNLDGVVGTAGPYNAATKTASLTIRYYVPGVGQFGTFQDSMTLP